MTIKQVEGKTTAHVSERKRKRTGSGVSGVGALATVMVGLSPLTLAVRSAIAGVNPNGGQAEATLNPIIVTGTEEVGVKARDSSTPIQVVTAAQLKATGATNVFDALQSLVPSFSASAVGTNTDRIVRSARLRGMNPGEVLVLVNGHRLHDTAVVTYFQNPNSPSNPADLDMIPVSMVDHVEVLLDGASALYGSDAVAGVINVILKHSRSGGTATATAGITSRGDGVQRAITLNHGFRLGNGGFFDVSAETQKTDYSYTAAGIDKLSIGLKDAAGQIVPPMRDNTWATPESHLTTAGFNAEIPLTDAFKIYADGTVGSRTAAYWDNDRRANNTPTVYPYGFNPRQTLHENDYDLTFGVKGSVAGWNWDIAGTTGRDAVQLDVVDTINSGLYAATGIVYTGGSLGSLRNGETSVDARVRKAFDIGLSSPLNLAAGLEYLDDNFVQQAGANGTWEDGGTQAEGGFTPLDATNDSRTVKAAYLDLSAKPVSIWTVEAAGRYEDYSDTGIGSTETGMITNRVAVTRKVALRATYSTGFHAPTLAEEHFSATAIQPTSETFLASATSPGAEFLGAAPLQPETSRNLSFGIVAEPMPNLNLTIDAYQINLDHRVIESATIAGSLALQAAQLNNPSFVAGAGNQAFFSFFANGVNTRTRGVDFSAQYRKDLQSYGVLFAQLDANFNSTTILSEAPLPSRMVAALSAAGQPISYLNPQVITDITESSPKSKIVLNLNWAIHSWRVNLRESRYGEVHENSGDTSAVVPFTDIPVKAAFITDLDIGYYASEHVRVDVGGDNVFDVLPAKMSPAQSAPRQAELYSIYTPWGVEGAYFYGRVTVNF